MGLLSAPSYGNTTTGAACIDSHRSFTKFMKALTVSLRNSSSLVKRSQVKNARTYLKGNTRRMAEDARRTNATCVVTCQKTNKYLGGYIEVSINRQLINKRTYPMHKITFVHVYTKSIFKIVHVYAPTQSFYLTSGWPARRIVRIFSRETFRFWR